MRRRRFLAACLGGIVAPLGAGAHAASSAARETLPEGRYAALFGDRSVTFEALDLSTGRTFVVGPSRVDLRRTPWSTFKIPNLVIALETGVARGLDHPIPWNPDRRPAASYWPAEWRRDQTLETAFRRSAPWAFQELAVAIGTERYREHLARFGYGNRLVPPENDGFWLDGTLRISVREQVLFLRDLLGGRLGVGPATLDALVRVSALDEQPAATLHGKTGAGPAIPGRFDGAFEGWLVGFVVRRGAPSAIFALHVEGPTFRSIQRFRQEAAERLLRQAGLF